MLVAPSVVVAVAASDERDALARFDGDEDLPVGGDDAARAAEGSREVGGREEDAVLDGAAAGGKVPEAWGRESGGDGEQGGAGEGQGSGVLRELGLVAHEGGEVSRGRHGGLGRFSGEEGLPFVREAAALASSLDGAGGAEDEGGVGDAVGGAFRKGGHEDGVVLAGEGEEGGLDGSAGGFGEAEGVADVVARGEELGEDDDVGAFVGGLGDEGPGAFEVRGHVAWGRARLYDRDDGIHPRRQGLRGG